MWCPLYECMHCPFLIVHDCMGLITRGHSIVLVTLQLGIVYTTWDTCMATVSKDEKGAQYIAFWDFRFFRFFRFLKKTEKPKIWKNRKNRKKNFRWKLYLLCNCNICTIAHIKNNFL